MASGTIKNISAMETGTLVNESYGLMSYIFNPSIRLCIVSWNGNGTTPPASVSADLPTGMRPASRTTNTILSGNYIEASSNSVTVSTGAHAWTAGYVAFFTN